MLHCDGWIVSVSPPPRNSPQQTPSPQPNCTTSTFTPSLSSLLFISMASAATSRPTFSFHLVSQQLVSSHLLPKASRFHFSKPPPSISLSSPQKATHFALSSIDVSKEDKPTAPDAQISEPVPVQDELSSSSFLTEEVEETEQQFDKRRLEEKFAVLNTGIYECRSCGYKYDEAVGDPSYPVPPGLPFDKLPEDWRCPTCGAAQSFFQSKSVEIAGFAQNQQYGLGGNTLTSGQKAILIYGSLLLFFALFLSGYFLLNTSLWIAPGNQEPCLPPAQHMKTSHAAQRFPQ